MISQNIISLFQELANPNKYWIKFKMRATVSFYYLHQKLCFPGMAEKLIYIPNNDTKNYLLGRLQ